MDFAIRQAIRDVRRVNAQYKSPEYTRLLHAIANSEAIMLITGKDFYSYQQFARLTRSMYFNLTDEQYAELEQNIDAVAMVEMRLYYRHNDATDVIIDVVTKMPGPEWDPYLVWRMELNNRLIQGPQWNQFNTQEVAPLRKF